MKTNKIKSMLLVVVLAMFATSSCSVEYRARHPRHPRPPRHKKVIVVGKAGETEKMINTNSKAEDSSETQTDIAVY